MKHSVIATAVLAALAPKLLLAEMSYSNVEVSFVDVEVGQSPFDVDGDGFEIAGSFELNNRVFVFGEWQDQDLDFGADGRAIEIGGGLRHALSDKVDFVATLSYLDAEIKAGSVTADDDGLALGGGVRTQLNESIELEAGLKYIDFDDSGNDTGFTFGGRYYFNPSMAVSASADFNDNVDTLRVGFRWEF